MNLPDEDETNLRAVIRVLIFCSLAAACLVVFSILATLFFFEVLRLEPSP